MSKKKKTFPKKSEKKHHALGEQRARTERVARQALLAKMDPDSRKLAQAEFEKLGLL
jgi:hypothetical protein